jgi:hypothetical protein
VDAEVGRKGELNLIVNRSGVSAPAQHVSNASALRASLVAFFLAFWEYVLKERGGLALLLLDDPHELLDDENAERLAEALVPLVRSGAQVVVTSYDARFASAVSRLAVNGGVDHRAVHPATQMYPVVRTILPLRTIDLRKARFVDDPNDEEAARDYVDACRVFLEAQLGDLFDDPAHSAWASANRDPTLETFLQRLQGLLKTPQDMFGSDIFKHFVNHPALGAGTPTRVLMNKSHHGRRAEIRAADVVVCSNELQQLLEMTEQMRDVCYRWRRRDVDSEARSIATPPALIPLAFASLRIPLCADLAAFTQHEPVGATQAPVELLDPVALKNIVTFYLRRSNFGFAAPEGAVAIVSAIQQPAADRALVIARHGTNIYARRLVRGVNSSLLGLTADVLDPRARTPKTLFLPDAELAIHPVMGILFDCEQRVPAGKDEAVELDASSVLKQVEMAFRVRDHSAVPLALDRQMVLGGRLLDAASLPRSPGALVALALDDGSTLFKRVGTSLPGTLKHLMQFESIGGLGSSQVLAVGRAEAGFRTVASARLIIGVLYA